MRLYLTENSCYMDNLIGSSYIILEYTGHAIIEDLTPIDYTLAEKDSRIIIYRHRQGDSENIINDLFNYEGSIKINRCIVNVFGKQRMSVRVTNRLYQYNSNYINSKSETMTLLSEEMVNKKSNRIIKKTILKTNIIKNIVTGGRFFNKDGTRYEGLAHHYLSGKNRFKYYTGAEPSKESKLLYTRKKYQKRGPNGQTQCKDLGTEGACTGMFGQALGCHWCETPDGGTCIAHSEDCADYLPSDLDHPSYGYGYKVKPDDGISPVPQKIPKPKPTGRLYDGEIIKRKVMQGDEKRYLETLERIKRK